MALSVLARSGKPVISFVHSTRVSIGAAAPRSSFPARAFVPLLHFSQAVYLRRGLGSHMPGKALFHLGPLAGVQVAPTRDRAVPFSWELWGMGKVGLCACLHLVPSAKPPSSGTFPPSLTL